MLVPTDTFTAHREVPRPLVHTLPSWQDSCAISAGFMLASLSTSSWRLEKSQKPPAALDKEPHNLHPAPPPPAEGSLNPPPLHPLPSRKAQLLLSAKSQSWKALRVGREHVPAGWLGEVLGIHSDLNNYSSYACDSAPESGIFLCPQGWVLLTQCWRGHLVSPPGLWAPHPLPFVPRGHQREADREGELLSAFGFISK